MEGDAGSSAPFSPVLFLLIEPFLSVWYAYGAYIRWYGLSGVLIMSLEPLSHPIDLRMERGERLVLKGANGIGKTTLLKTILGKIPALSGSVELGDYLFPGYFEQEVQASSNTCIEELWEEFSSTNAGLPWQNAASPPKTSRAKCGAFPAVSRPSS